MEPEPVEVIRIKRLTLSDRSTPGQVIRRSSEEINTIENDYAVNVNDYNVDENDYPVDHAADTFYHTDSSFAAGAGALDDVNPLLYHRPGAEIKFSRKVACCVLSPTVISIVILFAVNAYLLYKIAGNSFKAECSSCQNAINQEFKVGLEV